jgi:hypothetical protein
VYSQYALHGLQINVKPHKTSSIISIIGLGSLVLKRDKDDLRDLHFHTDRRKNILPLVDPYKHVGSYSLIYGRITHDVAHKAGLVRTATKPRKSNILVIPHATDVTRARIAESFFFFKYGLL